MAKASTKEHNPCFQKKTHPHTKSSSTLPPTTTSPPKTSYRFRESPLFAPLRSEKPISLNSSQPPQTKPNQKKKNRSPPERSDNLPGCPRSPYRSKPGPPVKRRKFRYLEPSLHPHQQSATYCHSSIEALCVLCLALDISLQSLQQNNPPTLAETSMCQRRARNVAATFQRGF